MYVNSGVKSSGANNNLPEPAIPKIPPPDPNQYTVRAYNSSLQTSGDRITILTISLYGRGYTKVRIIMMSMHISLNFGLQKYTIIIYALIIALFNLICVA